MAVDDDDPASLDWGEDANTALDEPVVEPAPEPVTAPHRTLAEVDRAYESGREAGCRSCYTEGQDDAIRALTDVFAESPGGVDQFALAVVKRVRAKLSVL